MKKRGCSLEDYSSVCTKIRKDFSVNDMVALRKLLTALIENRILKNNSKLKFVGDELICGCSQFNKYHSCRHVSIEKEKLL